MEKTFPLVAARSVAGRLLDLLEPVCDKLAVAGSVRRGCSRVHDLDLVILPVYRSCPPQVNLFGETVAGSATRPDALLHAIQPYKPDAHPDARVISFTFEDFPVELYLAEPGGANFFALLQMRTGSATFNVRMAARAKALGYRYHAGYGIFDTGGARLDDGSEHGLFATLRMVYVPPERRN